MDTVSNIVNGATYWGRTLEASASSTMPLTQPVEAPVVKTISMPQAKKLEGIYLKDGGMRISKDAIFATKAVRREVSELISALVNPHVLPATKQELALEFAIQHKLEETPEPVVQAPTPTPVGGRIGEFVVTAPNSKSQATEPVVKNFALKIKTNQWVSLDKSYNGNLRKDPNITRVEFDANLDSYGFDPSTVTAMTHNQANELNNKAKVQPVNIDKVHETHISISKAELQELRQKAEKYDALRSVLA
tara:strand:+ start:847 stop:1590 length:744 start_codon:yes stop_codon:yes gene_type:complete